MDAFLKKQKVSKIKLFGKIIKHIRRVSFALLSIFVSMAVLYWIYALITCGGFFKVQKIDVHGEMMHLTASDVVKASQIRKGQGLFDINIREIRELVKLNPWIDQVVVRRKLPNSVWIYVEEYVPELVIALDDLYYVNREGVVFKKLSGADEKNFPVVTGVSLLSFGSRENISSQLLDILKFKEEYEKTEAFTHYGLSEMNFDNEKGLSMVTMQGAVRLDVGTGEIELKMKKLDTVLAAIQRQKGRVTKINLVYEDKAIVKYQL